MVWMFTIHLPPVSRDVSPKNLMLNHKKSHLEAKLSFLLLFNILTTGNLAKANIKTNKK